MWSCALAVRSCGLAVWSCALAVRSCGLAVWSCDSVVYSCDLDALFSCVVMWFGVVS